MDTKIKWIIEKDIFREDAPDRLASIAMAKGMEVLRVQRIPFSNSIASLSRDGVSQRIIYSSNMPYPDDDCVIVYGSLNICQQLMNPKRWNPTAWFDLERFRCVSYYAHWGKWLLQGKYRYTMMPWGEMVRLKDFLYEFVGHRNSIFIKPDANNKTFSGSVVPFEKFEHWAKMNQDCYEIPTECLVVVAMPTPLLIETEWRFIVCDGKIVTGSQYKSAGETVLEAGAPQEAEELAAEIARHPWQPAAVYALDICREAGEYHLLECGPFNGAGLYKCDLEKIVDAVGAQALKEWTAAKKAE